MHSFPSLFWKFVVRHVNLFSIVKSVRCCPFLFDELCRLNLRFLFLSLWPFLSLPMTRTLCFGMIWTREDNSSQKAMSSVSSLTLVGLLQEMIVTLGLQLKVATIIPGFIFSMLFCDFRACGPISIPTPPIAALTEFFHTDTVASVHPLQLSWYLISSLCVYLCSGMHIMSMADAVSSGSCPILFKVRTLNVAICIVRLHFSDFCLSSVADFSNTEAKAPTSVKSNAVWTCGLSVGHGYLSMPVFYSRLKKPP